MVKRKLINTSRLDAKIKELQSEMSIIAEMIEKCINENAHVAQSQEEYRQQYGGVLNRFGVAKAGFEKAVNQKEEKSSRRDMLDSFIKGLREQEDLISEFDEKLWYSLVDKVTVHSKEKMRFTFKDGTVI